MMKQLITLKNYGKQFRKPVCSIARNVMETFSQYDWPGNVRQLENVIQAAVIASDTDVLAFKDLPEFREYEAIPQGLPRTSVELKRVKKELRARTVEKVERDFLVHALQRNDWNVTRAARDVGMQRTNFQGLMRKYGISVKRAKS